MYIVSIQGVIVVCQGDFSITNTDTKKTVSQYRRYFT